MMQGYMAANIFIKMETNDQEGIYGADLGLSISDTTLIEFEDVIDLLHKGDKIEFEAMIVSLGDNEKLHHLHSWSIRKVTGHMDFVTNPLILGNRYQLSN